MALGWTGAELAEAARVGINTVSRFEGGGEARNSSIEAMRRALELAGIEFIAAGGCLHRRGRRCAPSGGLMPHEALRYCNSFNRLPTLLALWNGLAVEADEWLALLGEEWSVCDNVGEHIDELFESPLGDVLSGELSGHPLMDATERGAFAALPDVVEVGGDATQTISGLKLVAQSRLGCWFSTFESLSAK